MEKSKMINRGKKIVAVALSFMMMIPVAFSQTTVTNAAAQAASATISTIADAITIDVVKNVKSDAKSSKDNGKLSLERGQEVQLQIKAKAAMKLESIRGKLSFTDTTSRDPDESPVLSNDIFTIAGADEISGWQVGYLANKDRDYYTVSINTNGQAREVKSGDIIASIRMKVQTSVDGVTVNYAVDEKEFKAQNVSDGSEITVTDGGIATGTLKNDFATTRGVTLSLPDKMTQKTYTFTASGDGIKKFSVPVKITSNSGFTGMTVKFTYDYTSMNYTGYQLSPQALVGLSCKTVSSGVTSTQGEVTLSLLGSEDVMIKGDFLTLNFEMSRGAKAGNKSTISGKILSLANESGTKDDKLAKIVSNSCEVTIVEGPKRGDVNGDGKITLIDATYALQFYNRVRDLTDEQQALADVNGRDGVTLVDVLMLLKFCNGENVTFAN